MLDYLYRLNATNTCETLRCRGFNSVVLDGSTKHIEAKATELHERPLRVILKPCKVGLYGLDEIRRAIVMLEGYRAVANQSN